MRSFVLWFILGLVAIGAAACGGGGGSTSAPTAAPVATTASNVITLPTPPPAGGTASVTLPGPIGLTPSLLLGPGFTSGTQLYVSTTNYGQTSSTERSVQTTLAACPVIVDLTMYFTKALPISALQGFTLNYSAVQAIVAAAGQSARFAFFTAQFYDQGSVQTAGVPLPPTASNGCASAPLNVVATSAGSISGNTVTFSSFNGNSGSGSIPANELVGLYVTFTASNSSPSPSASPSSGAPSPTPSATVSAAVTGGQLSNTSFSMPAFNGGSYSGTITSGAYSGNASDAFTITYGNYLFGTGSAPTPPPNSGNVYAVVSLLYNGTATTQSWSGTPSGNMSLTVPTTASKSTVTVRMWEVGGTNPNQQLCLGSVANATSLAVTPAAGGVLSFLSPLQAQTTTNTGACTSDPNINPLSGSNAGVWIIVTDT